MEIQQDFIVTNFKQQKLVSTRVILETHSVEGLFVVSYPPRLVIVQDSSLMVTVFDGELAVVNRMQFDKKLYSVSGS